MKRLTILLLMFFAVGCQSQAPVFSWYHPLGGEYLFEYDQRECQGVVADLGLSLGQSLKGPFFSCMQERGYSLVTAGLQSQSELGTSALVRNGT